MLALLRGLVRSTRKRAADRAEISVAKLEDRLRGLEPADQESVLRKLVVDYAATILGHGDSAAVDPEPCPWQACSSTCGGSGWRPSSCSIG